MVILHVYLRNAGNIFTFLTFRYNNGDDMPVLARELIVDVSEEDTYTAIQDRVSKILDEEKQNYGEFSTEQSGLVPCITID
jgi:hypothetical protein